MEIRIDVVRAAVAADEVNRRRRDDAVERLDRRKRCAGTGRHLSVRLRDMAADRLLEPRRLAVAGEARAVHALPRLARQIISACALQYGSARDERRAAREKFSPFALVFFGHIASPDN